uniref:Uncharacterized protein n=1 Tax=Anguilla anguilla TaxID=7936 RepID=A0A0E9PGJ8_ANGAN
MAIEEDDGKPVYNLYHKATCLVFEAICGDANVFNTVAYIRKVIGSSCHKCRLVQLWRGQVGQILVRPCSYWWGVGLAGMSFGDYNSYSVFPCL